MPPKRKIDQQSRGRKRARVNEASTKEVAPVTYSFVFTPNDAAQWTFPSIIPIEIWKAHVMPQLSLDQKTLMAMRSSCRGFLYLVHYSDCWNNGASTFPRRELLRFLAYTPQWPFALKNLLMYGDSPPSDGIQGAYAYDCEEFASWFANRGLLNLTLQATLYRTPNLLPFLSCWTTLRKLDVGINTLSIEALHKFPSSITSLSLFSARTSDQMNAAGSHSSQLVHLFAAIPSTIQELTLPSLDARLFEGVNGLQFYQQCLDALPRSLTSLYLFDQKRLTNATITHLPSGLLTLRLRHCDQITDQGLRALPPNLTELNLDFCDGFTERLLSNIAVTSLRSLSITGSRASQKIHLVHLAQALSPSAYLHNLRYIYGLNSQAHSPEKPPMWKAELVSYLQYYKRRTLRDIPTTLPRDQLVSLIRENYEDIRIWTSSVVKAHRALTAFRAANPGMEVTSEKVNTLLQESVGENEALVQSIRQFFVAFRIIVKADADLFYLQ